MAKNLVRNGGFERGDTQFWEAFNEASFAAVEVPAYKGTYSGKLIAGATNYPWIQCSDFIEMSEGDAFVFEGYCYPSTNYTLRPAVLYYDEGLDLIHEETLSDLTLGITQWTKFLDVVTYEPGADYFKVKLIHNLMGAGGYTAYDNLLLQKVSPTEVIGANKELLPGQTLEGAGTWTGAKHAVIGYNEATFLLDVYSEVGEGGTLDVKVQAMDYRSNYWYDIATFDQVGEGTPKQVLVITAGIGEINRVQATTVGVDAEYSIRVHGMYKR